VSSWCDKLASTPAVGFKLDQHFASSDAILDSLVPLLDALYWGDKARFSIGKQQTFEVQFTTEDGYHYLVDPTRISVEFNHRMRARPVSGGPPIMEMLSEARPFTEILKDVSRRLVSAAELIPRTKTRLVRRVGIVSATAIDDKDLPPGVKRFIEYMRGPWQDNLDFYQINIAAELGRGADWRDRCIHNISKTEDVEQLMTLNFDWQRLLDPGIPIESKRLTELLGRAEQSALQYFEDLAEGRRFDAELIRETAKL
jgi:hypothetical protein